MVQAYLSGPIIHHQARQDDFYRFIVEILENTGVTVFAPQFLPPGSPREIYLRDTQEVRKSDFLIAEVSHPSHGVGMEIMLAIDLMIPILLFRHADAPRLSHMVRGADCTALFEYARLDDVRNILSRIALESLLVRDCPSCDSHVVEVSEGVVRCVVCRTEVSPAQGGTDGEQS